VLVMGATGALGSCCVQVAQMLGAKVVAGAGADERVAAAKSYGADFGVNYRQQNLADEIMRLTGGQGVDVACENIADPTLWPGVLNSLAIGGRLEPRARTAAAKSNWTSSGFTCGGCASSAPRAPIFQMSIRRLKLPRRARFGRSLIELCRYAMPRERIEFWNGIRPWEKLFSTRHRTNVSVKLG